MYCPNCGAQAPDQSAFCQVCGTALPPASPEPQPPAAPPPPATPTPPQPPAAAPVMPPQPPAAPPQPTAQMPPQPPAAAPITPPPPVVPPQPTVTPGAYTKAPLGGRLLALIVDGIIAAALLPAGILLMVAASTRGEFSAAGLALVVLGGIWQLVYMLGRDISGGAGFGKRLAGLVVISSATGSLATAGQTILRQVVLYALGLIPAIGSLIEPIMVLADKQGLRLGDKVAKTRVARVTEAQANGIAVKTGKGAAIGVLVGAILVSVVGGAVGGLILARAVTGGAPPADVVVPVEAPQVDEPQVQVPGDEPAASQAEEPGMETEPGASIGAVNPETAVDAVGNLLNSLKENDVQAARGYATRRFQEDESWFFSPAGGALIKFEVVDTYQDAALWVVEVQEQWNSGPQKSRYFVIEEDNTARVDSVEFLQ